MSELEWWWLKRQQYNKGLLIGGIFTIEISIIINLLNNEVKVFEAGYYVLLCAVVAVLYLFYILAANIMFSLGWLCDMLFNRQETLNFRIVLFECIYWCSIVMPPSLVIYYRII